MRKPVEKLINSLRFSMSDESIDSLHFSVVREDLRREKIKIKL